MAGGGFRPQYCVGMGSNSQVEQFWIANGETKDIFQYDLVIMTADGDIDPMAAVTEGNIIGAFVGCQYEDAQGQVQNANFYNGDRAKDGMLAFAHSAPMQVYLAKWQSNAAVDATETRTSIGLNWDNDFVAGNTTTGRSGMAVENTQAGITGQANVKCVGLRNITGDDVPTAATSSTTYTHGLFIVDPYLHWLVAEVGI